MNCGSNMYTCGWPHLHAPQPAHKYFMASDRDGLALPLVGRKVSKKINHFRQIKSSRAPRSDLCVVYLREELVDGLDCNTGRPNESLTRRRRTNLLTTCVLTTYLLLAIPPYSRVRNRRPVICGAGDVGSGAPAPEVPPRVPRPAPRVSPRQPGPAPRVAAPAAGVPTPGTRGAGHRHPELAAPDAARGTRGATTGCRLFAPARVWAARVPGAAPGVPRPGCRVGRDAMEIHISTVSRAYLGSNLLIA